MEIAPTRTVSSDRTQLRFIGLLAAWTVLLSLVAFLSAFAQADPGFIPIWPATGIGLALLWHHGARYWPAVFVANTISSMVVGTPLIAASGVGVLEVLIALTALRLLRRWNVHLSLPDMRQFTAFVAALLVASSIASPLSALRRSFRFQFPPPRALAAGVEYFLSAAFSFLIFTPLVLAWSHENFPHAARRWLFLASMGVLAIAGWCVLSVAPALQDRLLFLLLPVVVICAVVAGIGGASAACVVLTMVLNVMAHTPASISETLLRSFFVLTAALTGYLIAVMFRERERAAAQMAYRAQRDPLTGLINRYEFDNRVNAVLRDAPAAHALMYLDLDQFKLINDTCGHLAGDDMLRQLSTAIAKTLPADAALARLGGDEFACLLPGATPEGLDEVASRLHDAVRRFEFPVGDLRFNVGVSIGTTFLSADDRSADEVLARADVACYAAKDQGRNRTHAYTSSDADAHGWHSDLQKISQLQAQLARGQFQLYAQQIVSIDDAAPRTDVYEILLRHADPDSDLPIGNVFESARRYGLTARVDRWVLEQAALFLHAHAATGLRLSVNVSAATLESDGFREFVIALPDRHRFAARQLMLEITEAFAVRNLTGAVETLVALRTRGIDICLDDFGSGVASFGYLGDLPVSIVKIDGRFVRDLRTDPAAEIVIGSLARIAALRGIRCVAEWVEDLDLIPRLRKLGVSDAQGFAIHSPAPLASIVARVRSNGAAESFPA